MVEYFQVYIFHLSLPAEHGVIQLVHRYVTIDHIPDKYGHISCR
jgi:hypothetical protein